MIEEVWRKGMNVLSFTGPAAPRSRAAGGESSGSTAIPLKDSMAVFCPIAQLLACQISLSGRPAFALVTDSFAVVDDEASL